jgi:hypothetical protein
MLPGTAAATSPAAQRRWHRDAWWAMPEAERSSVVLASGPGVACLAPLLQGAGEVVAAVREPLRAVKAILDAGFPPPKPATLRALGDEPMRIRDRGVTAIANPQARALLAPLSQADELPVTLGPPPDADRWRALLFDEAMPHVHATAMRDPVVVVKSLATRLGYPQKRGQRAAETVERLRASDEDVPALRHADLLRELNWLDAELFEHCATARVRPDR